MQGQGGTPTSSAKNDNNHNPTPCIIKAAYIIGIDDTKPSCPKTPKTSTSPTTAAKHTGGSGPGKAISVSKDPVTGDTKIEKADGTVIIKGTNGIISTFSPGGVATYYNPSTDERTVYNTQPDGILKTIYESNGDVLEEFIAYHPYTLDLVQTIKKKDGTIITQRGIGPDMETVIKTPDGTVTDTLPNGYHIYKSDGTVISSIASDSITITKKPDGTKITENKDGTWNMVFPKKSDGSVSTYYNNGNPQNCCYTITKMADGTTIRR